MSHVHVQSFGPAQLCLRPSGEGEREEERRGLHQNGGRNTLPDGRSQLIPTHLAMHNDDNDCKKLVQLDRWYLAFLRELKKLPNTLGGLTGKLSRSCISLA